MKTCTTCGMQAEDRASFCPCCGTSFITQPLVPPMPATPPTEVTPQAVAPSPIPMEEKKKKKGGHALPLAIIAVLTALTVTLATLWLSGSLANMLGKEDKKHSTANKDKTQSSATQDAERPSITVNTLPKTAATYGNGQEITTGQYLAYLYLAYENIYDELGLSQYKDSGMDPWELTFPYGEDGEQLLLSDYIIRATQDNIKRQIVLQQMMKDNDLEWFAEDEAELNKNLNTMAKDAYIDLGFNNTSYAYALKNTTLNEHSTFYGLYGKGGMRAVDELELRRYFSNNYLSYKMISIPLTDNTGKELDKEGIAYKWLVERMAVYQTVCEQQGFEAAYELYEKDQSTINGLKSGNVNVSLHTTVTIPTTTTPTTDDTSTSDEHQHNHRLDVDAVHMDEALARVISIQPYNKPSVVEYTDGSGIYTIALIERLNTSDIYEQSVENIIYEMRYEAFNQEVTEAMNALVITFDQEVTAAAKPEDFLLILNNR